MGLLFHSICLLTSCRPQLHTCEPVTVALHTSLQPGSSWTHFNSWQKSFVFRRTLEHRNGLWTKRTWMRQHFVLVIRLQRSLTNYAFSYLLTGPRNYRTTSSCCCVGYSFSDCDNTRRSCSDFGSISDPNNNFMAGWSQSNYIWPQAGASISTQDTSEK